LAYDKQKHKKKKKNEWTQLQKKQILGGQATKSIARRQKKGGDNGNRVWGKTWPAHGT